MAKPQISQRTRLFFLIAYVAILVAANWMAFGQWIPSLGEKGFWFYIGLLSLLLGSQLVTPFYSPPGSSYHLRYLGQHIAALHEQMGNVAAC